MEVTLENLKKAMQLCAEAHNAEFADWSENGQLGIKSMSIPVIADVQAIGQAFFKDSDVSAEYDYTTLWFGTETLDEVDTETLAMALPTDWINKITNE